MLLSVKVYRIDIRTRTSLEKVEEGVTLERIRTVFDICATVYTIISLL